MFRAIRAGVLHRPAAVIAFAACCVACAVPSATLPTASPPLGPAASEPSLRVAITSSTYGSLEVRTATGAECSAELRVGAATYGDTPPSSLPPRVAGTDGVVRWTYAAPRTPGGPGSAAITCRTGSGSGTTSGSFSIDRPPMVASALTVRVTTDAPPQASFNPAPAIVPLRDASAARMTSMLATEWKNATRGLGALQVVDQSADITLFVVAARGNSVNRLGGDGSQDVIVYVEDELGRKTPENAVATALHELGHIWCCRGPDADSGGHWQERLRDPGLYGVDKFGLMTDPVTCFSFGTVLSCPNRFSDREMRALGFATFPPPAPDPCVTRSLALRAEIASIDSRIEKLRAQVESAKGTLADLEARIRSIEAKYADSMPPAVYAEYQRLVSQYNALNAQTNLQVDQHNGLNDQRRALATEYNSLPCDSS
jgi:hypothetical protein